MYPSAPPDRGLGWVPSDIPLPSPHTAASYEQKHEIMLNKALRKAEYCDFHSFSEFETRNILNIPYI